MKLQIDLPDDIDQDVNYSKLDFGLKTKEDAVITILRIYFNKIGRRKRK